MAGLAPRARVLSTDTTPVVPAQNVSVPRKIRRLEDTDVDTWSVVDSDGTTSEEEPTSASVPRRAKLDRRLEHRARRRARLIANARLCPTPGNLSYFERQAVQPETETAYTAAINAFLMFCNALSLGLVGASEVDAGIVHFMNDKYMAG